MNCFYEVIHFNAHLLYAALKRVRVIARSSSDAKEILCSQLKLFKT